LALQSKRTNYGVALQSHTTKETVHNIIKTYKGLCT